MKMLKANHDGLQRATSIQDAWTIRTLAWRTMASQQWEGLWESQAVCVCVMTVSIVLLN
jgi:hypothetical protein